MTVRTLRERLLVDDDGLVVDQTSLRVTFITRDIRVPTLEREMRPLIVIKRRRNPALGIVAVGASGLFCFRKLPRVRVLVTSLTRLRRALKLHFFCADRHLMTCGALHGTMRAKQRELGFRMVKAIHVGPGSRVVAGFTA